MQERLEFGDDEVDSAICTEDGRIVTEELQGAMGNAVKKRIQISTVTYF